MKQIFESFALFSIDWNNDTFFRLVENYQDRVRSIFSKRKSWKSETSISTEHWTLGSKQPTLDI